MWGCKPPKSSNLFLSANESAVLGRSSEARSGPFPDPVLPRKLPRKRQQTALLRNEGLPLAKARATPVDPGVPAVTEDARATEDVDATIVQSMADVVASDDPATWARVEAIAVAVRALIGGGMAAQTIPLLDFSTNLPH